MRVVVEYGAYNGRRYGRPWIGKITNWPVGGKPEMEWGRYIGTDAGGETEIEARAGDIVRTGQKDYRGNNTTAKWATVKGDGSLEYIDATEARRLWDARQAAPAPVTVIDWSSISDEELLAEAKRRGLVK